MKGKNKGRPKLEGYWFSFKAGTKEKLNSATNSRIDSK